MTTTQLLAQMEGRRAQLRMSMGTLARRSGVSEATVKRMLSGGADRPSPVLDNVSAVAQALGLGLELGATEDVETVREEAARHKAERLVRMVQGTMALEAQGVDSDAIRRMVRRTECELLAGPPRRLWSE